MSIDKIWNSNGSEEGSIYFNEIRIYSRDNGSEYDFETSYRLDDGVGMLRPSINSVPFG